MGLAFLLAFFQEANSLTKKQLEEVRNQLYQLRLRSERRYKRLLVRLFGKMEEAVQGLEKPEDIMAALRHLSSTRLYTETAREAARQMATMVASGQRATWRIAAMESSQGRRIYQALMQEMKNPAMSQSINEIVTRNAQLIKTVPHDIANEFSHLAQKRWMEGVRPDEITLEMNARVTHLKEYEARRIARTESAKASSALVQVRSEILHLDFYIWRTARDGDRVRDSHQLMENVICRWSEPPDPEAMAGEKSRGAYHPGGIYNCRCIPLPILALEDIHFPCKAHKGGVIYSIGSMKEFRCLFGIGEREDNYG